MLNFRNLDVKNTAFKVFLFVIFLLCARVIFLRFCDLPLYADEAQYWLWSTNLDWGYFSKPPVIAWIIWLSTSIFGDAEWAVRLMAPILHAITAYVIYITASFIFDKKAGLISAITYITLPAVFLSSFIISTDAPLLFFWSVAILFLYRALERDHLIDWIALGAAVGFGMLTKYHMAIFGLCGVLYLVWEKQLFLFKNPKLYLAILIAAVIWSPNLIWNYNNEFVSFGHTADLASGGSHLKFNVKSLLEFLIAQFAIFGPILMSVLLIILFWRDVKFTKQQRFLISFSIPFLIVIALLAFYARAHANWAAPTYVAATILVSNYLARHLKWNSISLYIHIFIGFVFLLYPMVFNLFQISYSIKTDPYERLRSGPELGEQLSSYAKLYPDVIFAADNRKSLVSFIYYTKPHMLQMKKWNADPKIDDHFDLTQNLRNHTNKNIILVTNHFNEQQLDKYAEYVNYIATISYNPYKGFERSYRLYYLHNFRGFEK